MANSPALAAPHVRFRVRILADKRNRADNSSEKRNFDVVASPVTNITHRSLRSTDDNTPRTTPVVLHSCSLGPLVASTTNESWS